MTRRDYIELAAALKSAREDITNKEPAESQSDLIDGVGYAADWVADLLKRRDPKFDVQRFLKNAGVK